MVVAAFVTNAQTSVPDRVCVGTERSYWVEGLPGSVFTWTLDGETQTVTTESVTIQWTELGTHTLTVLEHQSSCDGELQTIRIEVIPSPVLEKPEAVVACFSYLLPDISSIKGKNLSGKQAFYDKSQAEGGTKITGLLTHSQTVWIYDPGEEPGCGVEVSFEVTIYPAPNLVVTSPTEVCLPETVDITAPSVTAGSDSDLTYTYWLDSGATLTLTNAGTISETGTYYIKATGSGGCSVTATVTVSVLPPIRMEVHNPPPVCQPSVVDVSAPTVTQGSESGLTFSYYLDEAATVDLANYSAISEPGTHTITIKGTRANGCSVTSTVTVTIFAQPNLVVTDPAPVCVPQTVDLSAAFAPETGVTYTYWADQETTIPLSNYTTISETGTHTYTIRAGNTQGCTTTRSVTVTIYSPPTVTVAPADILCSNSNYKVVSADAANYQSLQWVSSGDGSFDDPTVLQPIYTPGQNDKESGTVTLTISATSVGGGCNSATASIQLSVIYLYADVVTSTASCNGAGDGIIKLENIKNGLAPYRIFIDDGKGLSGWFDSDSYTGLRAGTYQVKVGDANGCERDLSQYTILEPDKLIADIQTASPTCKGNDGKIYVSNPHNAVSELSGIPGTYKYFIEKEDGVYSEWSDLLGATDQFTSGDLSTGTYTVKITDGTNTSCIQTIGVVTLYDAVPMNFNVEMHDITCHGANNGTLTITNTSGGSGNFEFQLIDKDSGNPWSKGWVAASELVGSITPGNYTLQMRDSNSTECVVSSPTLYTFTDPEILAGTATATDETCWNAKNGTITVLGSSGGHGSFVYLLEGVDPDPSSGTKFSSGWVNSGAFLNLSSGLYDLWVGDDKYADCKVNIGRFEIKSAQKILADVLVKPIRCFGDKTGEITVTTSGTGTYSYSIDGGNSWLASGNFTGLADGTYSVVIKDETSCQNTLETVNMAAPPKLVASYEGSVVNVDGKDVGTVTVTNQSGGTPFAGADKYKYSLDEGSTWQTSPVFTNLNPGTYTITVTDANDCIFAMSFFLRGTATVNAKYDVLAVTCNGRNDGSITLHDFSGSYGGKYEVSLDNGTKWTQVDTDPLVIGGLNAGSYDLWLREKDLANSDILLGKAVVSEPLPIQANVVMKEPEIGQMKNGVVEVTSVTGGSGVFEYRINGSAWQADTRFSGLAKGTYVVDIRDTKSSSADCLISLNVTVDRSNELTAGVNYTSPRCYGQKGIFTVVASGTQNFEYACLPEGSSVNGSTVWSKTNTFEVYDGNYSFAIRDVTNPGNLILVTNSQSASGTWSVTQPNRLELRYSFDSYPSCHQDYSVISVWGEGGTGQIVGDVGTHILKAGEEATYTIYDQNYITGQTGCMAQQDFESPKVSFVTFKATPTNAKCYGETGKITFSTPENGMPPYAYSVTGKTVNRTSTDNLVFDDLMSGETYTCTVTDGNGCKSEVAVQIGPMEPLAMEIRPLTSLCVTGVADIMVKAKGGTPGYLLNGKAFSDSVKVTVDLSLGQQQFTMADKNGCSVSTTLGPAEPPVLEVVSPLLACDDLTAELKVESPGYDPARYQYSLNGGTWSATADWKQLKVSTVNAVRVMDLYSRCVVQASVKTEDLPIPSLPVVVLTQTPTCAHDFAILDVTSPLGPQFAYRITGKENFTNGYTQVSPTFTNIPTDTYNIQLINTKNKCESDPVVIEVPWSPPTPVIDVQAVSPKCFGDKFTITVTAPDIVKQGKTYSFDGTYTFYFNENETFDHVTIKDGVATITGVYTESKYLENLRFEANGCMSTGTNTNVNIVVPELLRITGSTVIEQPYTKIRMGEIDLSVAGGVKPYTFLWTSSTFAGTVSVTTSDFTNLYAGNYSVSVLDQNNCMVTGNFVVPLNYPPIATADEYVYVCTPITENVLVNDYDPDPKELNDFIKINTTPVMAPEHAKNFEILPDGTFKYEVIFGYIGHDSFIYEISDKFGQTAKAVVTINVISDLDGDDIGDLDDPDADGDGILNVDEVLPGEDWKTADYDNDGHPNWLDIDSDNDGIVDNIEAQGTYDYIAPSGIDKNHNGIDDAYDPDAGGTKIIPVNTDIALYMPDNMPDFIDVDSDNDQVADYIEGYDYNSDGHADVIILGRDSDGDGLDDAFDTIKRGCNNSNAIGNKPPLQDFDNDGIPDWRDDNDDDDEFPTRLEDLNADGDFSNDQLGHVGRPEYLWYGRDCELFIPDAFSPNGDNVHDYFQIFCIEKYPNASIYIFDQQGNKLFEKDHYGNLDYWGTSEKSWWDGTTNNRTVTVYGNKVLPGTYYYVLRLGNGEVKKSFVFVSY